MQLKNYILVIIVSIIAVGCHRTTTTQRETYEYTDDYGMVSMVPEKPTRIVSLSPAITEIMFALGADDLIVGRTEFCVFPAEAEKIENIGGISNLNIEKVLSLEPDLILAGSMIPRKIVEQFSVMGVPIVSVIEQPHFDGLFKNIEKIGKLVGKSNQADSLNEELLAELQSLDTTFSNRKTVYYVVGYGSGGNFTAGGNTFINDIIRMSGGQNIASETEGWTFSLEALMHADPDYILIRAEDSVAFVNLAPYNQLTAVRNQRLIPLQSGMIDLQVPRNIEVIKLLQSKIQEE